MAHNYCTCWGNRGSCIDCAEEEIGRLKAELEEASTIANDNYQVILKCNGKINELKRQLAEAKASAEAWQDNCRLTEDELEKERNKHADIIGKLAERDAEIEKIKKDAAINTSELLRIQGMCQISIGTGYTISERVRLEYLEYQKENAALREEIEKLQATNRARYAENKELYGHWQGCLTANSLLREEIAEYKSHIDTLNPEAIMEAEGKYLDEIELLQQENTTLRGGVERLKQNIVDTLTERLSDVDTARKQVAQEILSEIEGWEEIPAVNFKSIKQRFGLEG